MIKNEHLIGKRFSKLTVLSFAEFDKTGKQKWLCRCDCGTEKIIYEQSFCRGLTKSCGCLNKESLKKRMSHGWGEIITKDFLIEQHIRKKISLRQIAKNLGCSLGCVKRYVDKHKIAINDPFYDIIGSKFGKLTVLSRANSKHGMSYWNVKCDCGNEKTVQGKNLVRRNLISCGCWNKEKNYNGCGDLSGSYWSRMVKESIRRNIEFNLDIEYCWNLFQKQKQKCALSGIDIKLDREYGKNVRKKTTNKQTASLDRINSNLGYIKKNVQWVHVDVNRMKSNFDQQLFVLYCHKISKHQKVGF